MQPTEDSNPTLRGGQLGKPLTKKRAVASEKTDLNTQGGYFEYSPYTLWGRKEVLSSTYGKWGKLNTASPEAAP